jgi:hypothetical protein
MSKGSSMTLVSSSILGVRGNGTAVLGGSIAKAFRRVLLAVLAFVEGRIKGLDTDWKAEAVLAHDMAKTVAA